MFRSTNCCSCNLDLSCFLSVRDIFTKRTTARVRSFINLTPSIGGHQLKLLILVGQHKRKYCVVLNFDSEWEATVARLHMPTMPNAHSSEMLTMPSPCNCQKTLSAKKWRQVVRAKIQNRKQWICITLAVSWTTCDWYMLRYRTRQCCCSCNEWHHVKMNRMGGFSGWRDATVWWGQDRHWMLRVETERWRSGREWVESDLRLMKSNRSITISQMNDQRPLYDVIRPNPPNGTRIRR